MKIIVFQLKETLHDLFPTRKLRLILLSLALIAAFISVSELAVAKLFTKIILNEATYSTQELVLLVGFFFIFFGMTRIGQFFQRIYRLRVFDKAFQESDQELSYSKDNWRWSLAIELSNILSTVTQMFVVILFFIYFNTLFGVIDLVIVMIVLTVLGRFFGRQIEAQRGFVAARRAKNPVSSAVRVSTRIKMGEKGILISGFSMILLLAALLYLSYTGEIDPANAVVLFFGLRMQNTALSGISLSLMRFARARTHSE